jgi:hypothetical protein
VALNPKSCRAEDKVATGLYSSSYVGLCGGVRVCVKKLSSTLVPYTRAEGLARWRRAARLHVQHPNVIRCVCLFR